MAGRRSPNPARTNVHDVPTLRLPAAGRTGRTPLPPAWLVLGPAGRAWWRFAWRSPQATVWLDSFAPAVARRALLEDMLVDADVKSRLTVMREANQLEDRLGLTPRSMVGMHWVVADDVVVDEAPAGVSPMAGRRVRLADAS